MKKFAILLILLIGFTSIQVSGKWFQQKTIYSKSLKQEKTYYVSLPKGYNASDTTKKYPVIIFLHGASVTATEMVNTLELLLLFINTNNLAKIIFIVPDGSCEPYKGSFYTNSTLYGNYEDYIVQDMMEEVGSKYNTYNHRGKWSIMGHSMGGYGAMKIALKYPGNFIGVSALSGPLNVTYLDELLPALLAEHGFAPPYEFTYSGDVTKLVYSMAGAFSPQPGATPPIRFPINSAGTFDPTVKAMWEKHNPINLIKDWKGNPPMAIHTYCGERDEFKLAKPNQMFSDTLYKYKVSHTYYQDPLGDHSTSLLTSLPQGINFLYQVMDTAQVRVVTLVNMIPKTNAWCIYPNPANDRFFVSGVSDNLQRVSIHNLLGQNVLLFENHSLTEVIDISELNKGVYCVSLLDANGHNTIIRLIKK